MRSFLKRSCLPMAETISKKVIDSICFISAHQTGVSGEGIYGHIEGRLNVNVFNKILGT